jgi:cytochrome o ubiquinol oxidase subunit III
MKPLAVHHTPDPFRNTQTPDIHQDTFSKTILGFWMYLMTDCILFAALFSTYAVLHNSTFGGPSSRELFSLPISFTETMILLCSSLTCGLGMLSSLKNKKKQVLSWLSLSFLLGISFVAIELNEFSNLLKEGNSWTKSAFLSSFFTLVGTHGLHVSIGLLWMVVVMIQVSVCGITSTTFRRLAVFSMFWHFLDLVWIFIFTFVYLMGAI